MELKAFLLTLKPEEREDFAKKCGTSRGHLQNVAYGKPCAPALATAIELHSARKVTRPELRADWQRIWPEIAPKPSKRRTARAQ